MNANELLTYLQAGQSKTIPYNPNIAKVLGSMKAAIFLQQVCYWWANKGGEAFYKFMDVAKHPYYIPTDSWREELAMGISELQNARNAISTKAENQKEINDLLKNSDKNHCIIYYVDTKNGNLTWWIVNPKAVGNVIKEAIKLEIADNEKKQQFRKSKLPFKVSSTGHDETSTGPNETSIGPIEKLQPDTENTTEITSENTAYVFSDEKNEDINIDSLGKKSEIHNVPKTSKKPRTKKSNMFQGNGKTFPSNFGIRDGTVEAAIVEGYEEEIVNDELQKFINHYSDKKLKRENWKKDFIHNWLNNNYIRGLIKRNGQFYKLDANQERLQSIERNRDPDMFAEFR